MRISNIVICVKNVNETEIKYIISESYWIEYASSKTAIIL